MSVQTSVRVAGPFDGNDLTTDFGFEFVVLQAADVLVIKTSANGVELPLVKDVDYTVTLNDSTPGGTVGLTTPLPTGEKLTLTSDLQPTQGLQIPNLSAFHPKILEAALDKLTILVQQLADKITRTVQAPISGGTSAQQLLEQLAAQLPLVAAVYSHLAYIQAVAANQSNVDTVATSIAPINAIAADMTGTWQDGVKYDYGNCTDPIAGGTVDAVGNIVTIAGNIDDVNTTADNIADVITVSLHISAVDTVAADIASVNSVVANQANIDTVADDLANIGIVATSIASVDAVVADQANVDAVASALGDVDTVANNIADVNAVADNHAAINAVATDLQGAPVAIDYGNASAPTNPASPTGVLAAVYSNASNITAVAQQIAAVQTVAANLAAILAALSGGLTAANNLSELTNPAAARAHLGLADLGTAAP